MGRHGVISGSASSRGVSTTTLGEDEVTAAAEDAPASLFEEDAKGEEGGLVHAVLVNAPAGDAGLTGVGCGGHVAHGGVVVARVEVDGLEEVAVRQDRGAGQVSLVRHVDVALGIAFWRGAGAEECLFRGQGDVVCELVLQPRRAVCRWPGFFQVG